MRRCPQNQGGRPVEGPGFLSWCGDADGSNDDAANVEGHVVSLIRWYERGPSQRGESVAEMENVE